MRRLLMDFKKIARIFIIAFGLLNIYLIFGIFRRQDIQYTASEPADSDVLANVDELDIELPDMEGTDVSDKEIYSLQVNEHELFEEEMEENDDFSGTLNDDGAYYESFPSNPIELEGDPTEGFTEADYELLEEFVESDRVMLGDNYDKIHYEQESRRFVLNQFIDDIPIADGTSEISLFVNEKGEIYAYQQTYAGEAMRQGSPLNIIDATRAIEILFLNNEIRQGSEIKKPVLTYRRALHLEDLSMYSPVWLINTVRSSEVSTFRVDAVNGTIIKQPSSSSDSDQENGEDGDENEDQEEDTNTEQPPELEEDEPE